MSEFKLCPPHLALLMDECRRKGLPLVGVTALEFNGDPWHRDDSSD